jgi:HEPN domain-containing protein
MPNQTYALEWLELAGRNLKTAELLYQQNHFSDIIAIEIHQTIEKTFKAVLAYKGVRIPKTHDLLLLSESCNEEMDVSEALIDDLLMINDYYESQRYPGPRYSLPDKAEIEQNLSVAKSLHEKARDFVSHFSGK